MSVAATSLKVSKELKSRIARLAKRSGESPHALMLRLLEQQVESAERFERFVAEARLADERMLESGLGIEATDAHDYLAARIAGRKAARPKPVAWRR